MSVRRIEEQNEWVCDDCGGSYQVISTHWTRGDCAPRSIDARTAQTIVGMVLGDGHIESSGTKARFVSEMTNRRFVEWLYDELGWLTTQVVRSKTASEMYDKEHTRDFYESDNPKFRPVYRVATLSHPELNQLDAMYDDNGKAFPDDMLLTPQVARMWYVGDGTLMHGTTNSNSAIQIEAQDHVNAGCADAIVSAFEDVGFDVSVSGGSLALPTGQTEAFFDWIGSPPPGFEYKWARHDPDRYKRLKREAYEPIDDDL